jgi:predicted Zn-ribbon and HTH transcriptional regulator
MGRKKKRELVEVEPSRCRKCGSTNRTSYLGNPQIQKISGFKDGREYNEIHKKRTSCQNCGQHRFDKIYHQNNLPNS